MKQLLLALFISCSWQGIAQDPILYEHTWHLHELIIDGISEPFPLEAGGVILIFDEDLLFDWNFQTFVCQEANSELMYDDPNSSFSFVQPFDSGGLVCDFQSWLDFEQLYFDFFRDELASPFVYNITSSGGDFLLVITSESGNSAIYGDKILAVPNRELLNITLYPNPTDDLLNLSSSSNEILSVHIYTIEGRLVSSIKKEHQDISEINVSHLKSGVYFLTISTDIGQVTKKIIKK